MASIKGANRSAWVALAPDAPYLAAGTMAGAVDLSFSSSANLEIFKLDFQSDDHELPVVAECPSAERFNRLAWGKRGSWSDDFSLGLIAGGLVDGSIHIWNPLSLIRSEPSENARVKLLSRHAGPVRGLEFNAFTSNLLASGADDGEVCIWDLAAPAEQALFSPLKGSGSTAQGEISFLSWNSRVQHILASTSYNGTTVVWDLKKQKPAISFSDKRRSSVLQWNPDLATQLVVASDEDGSPSLRLWDMRQMMSPVREFVGHTKGVIAMSWLPIDSSYLLTCAKDNRTICWDTITGEIVGELPAGTNWNFDVHWYPKIPGVISASSFDGKIGIYNIEGCSRYGVGEGGFHAASLRAPKWYKRPVGTSFGFGGKLVSFHPRVSSGSGSATSDVFVHDLVFEQSLASRSSEFKSEVQNGERPSLRALCERKSEESESVEDRETWGFLKVMFEDDGTARTKLLMHLGFSLPQEEKVAVEDELSRGVNAVALEDKMEHETLKAENSFAVDNGEDFFNKLSSPKADTPVSASNSKFVVESNAPSADQVAQVPDELEESTNSFDDAVQQALVMGDYKGAVNLCLSANKFADALVISHVGGATLWESTRDQYIKISCSPYLKIVAAMVNNDLGSLVQTRPLKFWKETLALLCTFAQREEWTMLCDALASKLMSGGHTLPATLCFICAGNIDKTVEIWSRSLTSEREGKSYVDLLQELMEKTIVLALATGQKKFSASLFRLVEKYIEILASQGLLTTALEYVKLLDTDELSPELVILKDRILLWTEPDKQSKYMFENHQANVGATFEAQQQLYSGLPTSQTQSSVLGSPYNGYQQTYSPYGGGYPASAYQAQPQSQPQPQQQQQLQPANMFVPSEAPHVSQGTFAPSPASTQPAMRTFVPSNPQALRNPEQYNQAPTLGSQLYPGASNPPYPVPPSTRSQSPVPMQVGSVPVPKIPQPVTTVPLSGFMPVTNPAGAQRSKMGPSQPASPTNAQVQPVSAPPAPPPTVQTVNTSNVPAHLRPIVTTLTRLFNETSEVLGGPRASVPKKREIDENSKKIGALFAKLNSGEISGNASDKLIQLCQALDKQDFATALQIQVLLTTTEWDECNFWLASLKRMIRTRQSWR